MTSEEIKQKILKTVLKVRKDLSSSKFKEEASLTQDLGFDSMALVALAGALEKEFDQSLPLTEWVSEERDRGLTLGSLLKFLTRHFKQNDIFE